MTIKKRKKRKTRPYIHPIAALDPNLSKEKKLNNKINNRVIGIWGIFIIVVCLLIPGFEILSDFVRCGWLKC